MVEAIAEESLQGILDRMENVLETVTVSALSVTRAMSGVIETPEKSGSWRQTMEMT